MSVNGEHFLALSFGDFADTENLEEASAGQNGAMYEFSRASTGWTAEALDPPASEFPRREFVFASADLTRSLWRVQVPAHDGEEFEEPESDYDGWTLAVRDAAGGGKGRFTVVGPVVAPGHERVRNQPAFEMVGASSDLSRVLLAVRSAHKQLWAGDGTVEGGQSLYEYAGTGETEPVLVGVSNSGPVDGSPHVNEGADLVSECGTAFAAVSGSGELVYFTAEHVEGCAGAQPAVSELYVRAGGVSTVDVSEPPLSLAGRECTGVCVTDETVPGDRGEAVFQGASADGSRVFFTSTQPLVNGAVGKGDCLYEATVAGEGLEAHVSSIVLLAGEVSGVSAVAGEGTRVYFTSESDLTTAGNANGEKALAGVSNLYVAEPAKPAVRLAFVAREATGVQTTRDGEYAAFSDTHDLTGTDDTSTVEQLFEYTAPTGEVARVSIGAKGTYECPETKAIEEGYNCNGNTSSTLDAPMVTEATSYRISAFAGTVTFPAARSSYLSLSEDGVVVFISDLALTPQTSPNTIQEENVYEYRGGDVYLISPGDEASPNNRTKGTARLLGVDESGRNVFFLTTDSLVPQDSDTQSSWYDARVEGGFPAPVTGGGCLGEGCQGTAGPAPTLPPTGGSAVAPGGGDLAPVVVKPVSVPVKSLSRAQKLKRALVACRRVARRKRHGCEVSARARYGPKRKARKAVRG